MTLHRGHATHVNRTPTWAPPPKPVVTQPCATCHHSRGAHGDRCLVICDGDHPVTPLVTMSGSYQPVKQVCRCEGWKATA